MTSKVLIVAVCLASAATLPLLAHSKSSSLTNALADQLVTAVAARDLTRTKDLLSRGAPLTGRDTHGRTPLVIAASFNAPAPTTPDTEPETNEVLLELLRNAAKRATGGWEDSTASEGSGVAGRSFVAWLDGNIGLQVFGRSGGLLLAIDRELTDGVASEDVDGDGRKELTLSVQAGKGTGVFLSERRIYFFDGQRFAEPLTVTDYAYEDGSWNGIVKHGAESFGAPIMSFDGRIDFRDTDGDGIADLALAIERRWWGERDEEKVPAIPQLAEGSAWASRALRNTTGLPLGTIQTRVTGAWQRASPSGVFMVDGTRVDQRWK